MVFYLQQNVVLLDQISKQISFIVPQVPISSTPPPPFPSFKPLESDIRVNVLWFLALVLSLSAALLAILVQKWGRDYMNVFQRSSDPLKCARLRQYLHNGLVQWHMPAIAESVPGLFQASFFLFFVGLFDSVLNVNATVGVSTTIPIAISCIYYVTASIAPVVFPQSPYQTTLTAYFWRVIRAWGLQRMYRGSDGTLKPVSQKMIVGQMQFAMEETERRKWRDEQGIQWLIRNMTEEAEMESLMMAIPGSFNSEWGSEVWKNVLSWHEPVVAPSTNTDTPTAIPFVGDLHSQPMALPPMPGPPNVRPYSTAKHIQGDSEHIRHELNARVAHLMETCKNRDLFASEGQWRRRIRGCIETMVSLVCCAGIELGQFGDIVKPLGDIGADQKVRESSLTGKDHMFVMRWTCLSLVAIQPILASHRDLHNHASLAISSLTENYYHTGNTQTLTHIIETFNDALECLEELSNALILVGNMEEEARKILCDHQSPISTLVDIGKQYDGSADMWIQAVQRDLVKTTHRIICQMPGIKFDDPDTKSTHPSQLQESYRDRYKFQFISPSLLLKRIEQVTNTFQDVLIGPWDYSTFDEGIKDLQEIISLLKDNPLRREVWRLQDLCEGRGLGFTVELFFLALKELLSTSSSIESHYTLLMGTFRAITSDSSEYKSPLGTQQLLLDWVVSDDDIVFDPTDTCPDFIIDEFFSLLATVLKGQRGPHIDDIVQQLTEKLRSHCLIPARQAFYDRVLAVITRAGVPEPPS